MDLSGAISAATAFIADRESFSPSPYWDVNGYAIGYGNHYYSDGSAVSGDDDPISQSDAYDLLSFYVAQNVQAIANAITVPLTDNQFAALASIRYNCGTITQTLANLINSGADPEIVAAQIEVTCATSGGQPSAVIIARRHIEAELYASGGVSGSGLWIAAAIAAGVIFWAYEG
jgi:lysozyme